jgi:hypothetical protein
VTQNKIVMTTITLKINEKSKAGKTLLSMVQFFNEEKNGVEILKTPNLETLKAMYEVENKMGLTRVKNSKELFKKLGI